MKTTNMKMIQKFARLALLILVTGVLTNNLNAQKQSSILANCASIGQEKDRKACEKITLMDFIYTHLWKYFENLGKYNPESTYNASMEVDSWGLMYKLAIYETNYTAKEFAGTRALKIEPPFTQVMIPGFIKKDSIVIRYQLPNDFIQDDDYSKIFYYNLRTEIY